MTQTQESRIPKSKVKPRIIPSAVSNVNSSVDHMHVESEDIPHPTTIATMQNIGTQLCAIPAEELTEDMLTAGEGGASSASSP